MRGTRGSYHCRRRRTGRSHVAGHPTISDSPTRHQPRQSVRAARSGKRVAYQIIQPCTETTRDGSSSPQPQQRTIAATNKSSSIAATNSSSSISLIANDRKRSDEDQRFFLLQRLCGSTFQFLKAIDHNNLGQSISFCVVKDPFVCIILPVLNRI
ncbi:hypothetical protein RHMOL_Rhmol01G0221100 [Rhododendron molle]|uniref:Uncharacterized protein n=1 Tax=Rhododendron molle TaxID=49168 RepID=A0ACC0Q7A5_RHOML|nr:hypothetical protein RHMOL_Rhmol01G0221100 [Rhododendron molle]